jgi:hypothetical protein
MRFQELIGNDLQNRKNQYEKSANYQPLTAHTKIKFSRGLFAHRRTRSIEADELICPMNENGIPNGISPSLKVNPSLNKLFSPTETCFFFVTKYFSTII